MHISNPHVYAGATHKKRNFRMRSSSLFEKSDIRGSTKRRDTIAARRSYLKDQLFVGMAVH
jgi:hypothetical protein|tara:strand:+ start:440 stop:622 length:183 start_codon:yes stop_codon:yes gene_type:complete